MSVPFVIDKVDGSERVYDIYSRLLEDRIIFIGSDIDDDLANSVIAQLLLLDQKDSTRDIKLYINSCGGVVTAGMAIYDTMQYIKADVVTVCVGMAASMAALLMSSGTKGKRLVLPNSRLMIHEPRHRPGSDIVTVSEQIIDTDLFINMREQTAQIIAKNTGKKLSQVMKDIKLDKWFTAEEAVKYGLADDIVISKPEDF